MWTLDRSTIINLAINNLFIMAHDNLVLCGPLTSRLLLIAKLITYLLRPMII